MDYSILQKSMLFKGIPENELKKVLDRTQMRVNSYEKGETVFHLMEDAFVIGIILKGQIQAQKPFPNGSQINVTTRLSGDVIGPAAVFSESHRYPCDMIALKQSKVLMLKKEGVLTLMQRDERILENFITGIATTTHMLQQRLELLSYSGIAQKAAFYLLTRSRQSGKDKVRIPKSVSNWAMIMNVSRSSLHRELKRLEEEDIISYVPPVIEIRNQIALQNVLGK